MIGVKLQGLLLFETDVLGSGPAKLVIVEGKPDILFCTILGRLVEIEWLLRERYGD